MAKNKMFVVEARRLLPLLFLLVLLVSLSVYDSFRASPTVAPEEAAKSIEVSFTTADKGERKDTPTFRLAVDGESWAEIAEEWNVALPAYPFQPQHEVALFALHAEVKDVQARREGEGQLEVQVRVNPKRDYYQVVTLPAMDVTLAEGTVTWKFVDKKDNLIDQFVVENTQETAAVEEIPEK
ncbi:MAG: hypothetical protein GX167_00010 [Firmicutes bacterium]|jgi:hypothetical protein|nr:hypothetical protein [Bacillota bacterium]